MNPVQRLQAVLQGRRPDRPPVSFWHHFPHDQVHGPPAVQAHLTHLQSFSLDFLKVMNDNGYPHSSLITSINDLPTVVSLRGNEEGFSRQLQLLSDLKRALAGHALMITTIFNAFAVLRYLIQPPKSHNPPNLDAAADLPSRQIMQWAVQDQSAVRDAMQIIGANLARFAQQCLQAGADGIFLSVRDDWVQSPGQSDLYHRLVRPSDLEILAAVSHAQFNMLHVCGRPVDFPAFANYPVHAVNWADRAAGPSIKQVKLWLKPAICGGIDNLSTLPQGSAQDVTDQVQQTMFDASNRPIIIAPGCTYDPNRVPRANLQALSRSVAQLRYAS